MLRHFMMIAAFGVLLMSLGCDHSTPSSITSPSPPPITPVLVVDQFISIGGADPAPLPKGSPQGFCGLPVSVPGTIKVTLTSVPGVNSVQVYLISKSDLATLGCGPGTAVCPGAIDPMIFTSGATKTWSVNPGSYCIALRNLTEAKEVLNLSSTFEHF
ncbi:hypothetical protein H0W91_02160 [Patescibacteria group bacterium]|nr:hypothetical protein [Patescibacteria group bacterium]